MKHHLHSKFEREICFGENIKEYPTEDLLAEGAQALSEEPVIVFEDTKCQPK